MVGAGGRAGVSAAPAGILTMKAVEVEVVQHQTANTLTYGEAEVVEVEVEVEEEVVVEDNVEISDSVNSIRSGGSGDGGKKTRIVKKTIRRPKAKSIRVSFPPTTKGADAGYLLGLKTLIKNFEDILDEFGSEQQQKSGSGPAYTVE